MAGKYTLPGTLLSGTHSGRPAASAVASGALYAETDTKQTYQSDGASTWTAWGAGAAAGIVQAGMGTRTAGDLTTSSTSWADADSTNLSVTLTTGAHRCLLMFTGAAKCDAHNNNLAFDLTVDGTRVGQAYGLALISPNAATVGQTTPVSLMFLTTALSAASHTFRLQWKTDSASLTGTLFASTTVTPAILTVLELGI